MAKLNVAGQFRRAFQLIERLTSSRLIIGLGVRRHCRNQHSSMRPDAGQLVQEEWMRVRGAMESDNRGTAAFEDNKIHFSDENAIPSTFFVVGPPRTGTSWLHEVLRRHTNLPGPTKETRFFDLHFQRGVKWYRGHFPNLRPDRLSGEVAPTYFASPDARRRIAQTVPTAKLIFIFRNPVQRVVSLYRVYFFFSIFKDQFGFFFAVVTVCPRVPEETVFIRCNYGSEPVATDTSHNFPDNQQPEAMLRPGGMRTVQGAVTLP